MSIGITMGSSGAGGSASTALWAEPNRAPFQGAIGIHVEAPWWLRSAVERQLIAALSPFVGDSAPQIVPLPMEGAAMDMALIVVRIKPTHHVWTPIFAQGELDVAAYGVDLPDKPWQTKYIDNEERSYPRIPGRSNQLFVEENPEWRLFGLLPWFPYRRKLAAEAIDLVIESTLDLSQRPDPQPTATPTGETQ